MSRLCGADGCRAGWIGVTEDLATGTLFWAVSPSLEHLASESQADVIALDVPIGLPDSGSRACDVAARQLLGPGRGSSVFPAPIRPILVAKSHTEACAIRETVEGKRISVQAWAIVPKILEVDLAMRTSAELAARVREVHPEVSFFRLANRPLKYAKKTLDGREERLTLLRPEFGPAVDSALSDCRTVGCAPDDMLDAFVGLWTARRVCRGQAITLPADPPKDRYGLPMEMVA